MGWFCQPSARSEPPDPIVRVTDGPVSATGHDDATWPRRSASRKFANFTLKHGVPSRWLSSNRKSFAAMDQEHDERQTGTVATALDLPVHRAHLDKARSRASYVSALRAHGAQAVEGILSGHRTAQGGPRTSRGEKDLPIVLRNPVADGVTGCSAL